MTKLESQIAAVVVYPDRARVTRSGTVALQAGDHRLEVGELPSRLDEASVRASARGTARARLLGVDVRREFYAETPAERVRELERRVEELEDEMRGLDARAELLTQERSGVAALIGQTEAFARGLAFGKTDVEAQMALYDGLRERADGLDAALLELAGQRRELEGRLEKARSELERLREGRERERRTAVVEIEVSREGELTLELDYVVPGAGWRPLYDLRLGEEGEEPVLEVGYLAQVTQRTGEDWNDVVLRLSTARPALAETIPELDPWYVRPVPEVRRMRVGADMVKAAAPPPPAATAGAEPEADRAVEEAQVAMAAVEGAGAAVTYRVPGSVTVPADGAPHKVTVARLAWSPELDYVAAPKLVEAVYRRARVTNESDYTLLPGTASLFTSDQFVGTVELEMVAPQGEVELYLGADDRIRVERELKRRQVDKRLIGGRRRLRYAYAITLENLGASEAQITLHDQVPVPRHEEIKVKLGAVEPGAAERTDLGLLDWRMGLAAGETQVVRFDFTVEHPPDMRLVGLP